ncbi:Aste57867_22101 [Aphanomyces stellatus]|uniref:Aste57867_22101 protein n=1 Tax=Aphanomyces stellatus TaxID=120398 RepID=A0A485LP89_9STRA|nr:hypothetical protein As57867_022032 [Aphanomyces stellatus]VFT98769.1 Aste57867_22101 [Aphanomyces stellatus]
MHLRFLATAAAALAGLVHGKATWYPCPLLTIAKRDVQSKGNPTVECADIPMPLCYPGVCNNTKASPINLFVKRIPAAKASATPQALWMLQGGPGESSINMEVLMYDAWVATGGLVSVYTMDHRGTGRSELLGCAEGNSPYSPSYTARCLSKIKLAYGESAPAAFSVTSAATDLATVIQNELATSEVFVYGLSYGTYLVERVMHLAPKGIKGYILDSIQSEIFYKTKDAPYYSNWDRDVGGVVETYLSYCDTDTFCASKIGPNAKAYVQGLYAKLDNGQNKCADVIKTLAPEYAAKPSWAINGFLYTMLKDYNQRNLIPAVLYRLNRCNTADQGMVANAINLAKNSTSSLLMTDFSVPGKNLTEAAKVSYLTGEGRSTVVYKNIVLSEIWELPTPSADQQAKWFNDALMGAMSPLEQAQERQDTCIYLGNKDPMCKAFSTTTNVSFSYARDAYWNKTAAVPAGASVLMFTGLLDSATPPKYARDEFATMDGTNKKLLEFAYSPHVIVSQTPTDKGDCGGLILAAYIASHGDLTKLPETCIPAVYKLNFTTVLDSKQAVALFGTDVDIYGPGAAGPNPAGTVNLNNGSKLLPSSSGGGGSGLATSVAPVTPSTVTSAASSSVVFSAILVTIVAATAMLCRAATSQYDNQVNRLGTQGCERQYCPNGNSIVGIAQLALLGPHLLTTMLSNPRAIDLEDRVSYIQSAVSHDDSYAVVKSPAAAVEGGLDDGALVEGGAISLCAREALGLFSQYAAIGVLLGMIPGLSYPVFNVYLQMEGYQTASYSSLVTLGWSFKVFFGMLSDCVPIGGYRRKSWMLIGWSITLVCLAVMAFSSMGDPYCDRVKAASRRSSACAKPYAQATAADQASLFNVHAPDQGTKFILLSMFVSFGYVTADCAADAMVVEYAQREPLAIRGRIQTAVYVVRAAAGTIGPIVLGLGLNGANYGGSFSFSMAPTVPYAICLVPCVAVLCTTIFVVHEPKTPRVPLGDWIASFWALIQQRVMWQICAFRLVNNVFQGIGSTAGQPMASVWAGVEPLNNSLADILGSLIMAGVLVVVAKWGLHWNWRWTIATCSIAVLLIDGLVTFLTIWAIVRNQWFFTGVALAEAIPDAVRFIVASYCAVEIADVGNEGATYGLVTTVSNLASPFATVLYKYMDSFLLLSQNDLKADTTAVRWDVTYSYFISYGCKLFALVWLFMLPPQRGPMQELKRTGGKSTLAGIVLIAVFVVCLAFAVTSSLMAIYASTKCYRIAGGNGKLEPRTGKCPV